MSWLCPYQIGELCKRVKKICKPGMKGCVLRGKVKFVELEEVNVKNTEEIKGFGSRDKKHKQPSKDKEMKCQSRIISLMIFKKTILNC